MLKYQTQHSYPYYPTLSTYPSKLKPIFRDHLDECLLTKSETNKCNELTGLSRGLTGDKSMNLMVWFGGCWLTQDNLKGGTLGINLVTHPSINCLTFSQLMLFARYWGNIFLILKFIELLWTWTLYHDEIFYLIVSL